jgi:hypothetical protein
MTNWGGGTARARVEGPQRSTQNGARDLTDDVEVRRETAVRSVVAHITRSGDAASGSILRRDRRRRPKCADMAPLGEPEGSVG